MKLYTGPLSLFSAKVRLALDEKQQSYDHVSVGFSVENRYQPHHPDVDALNPKGQVPILVDGDTVVADSTQILEYLEERFPDPPLYPSGIALRARCRRLEAFADEILFAPLWDLIEEVFYRDSSRHRERAGAARSRLGELFEELDRELEGREYLCDTFSVADLSVFIMLGTAATLGAPPDPALRRLAAWLARTGARPAVRREMEAMQAYAAGLLASSPRHGHPEDAATALAAEGA